MESEYEETSVTLGISIPIDSSKKHEFREIHPANDEQPDVFNEQLEFSNLIPLLDPNLGILRQLPSSNIAHEKSLWNSWNIEPHFLHILPLSTSGLNDDSILVFGGLDPSSILKKMPLDFDNDDFVLGSTIFQYVLGSGVWKYYGTMIEPRCYHACALDGQYLYVTGGYSLLKRKHGEMLAISSTDRLNLNDRQWKNCANMVMSRAVHALVSHKGYLYAFGGRDSQGSILASVEMYDPDQNIWIEITSLPQPTMGLSATCIMDSVWLVGGITDYNSRDPSECLLSNVFSFIPSMNKWCKEVSLPYACAFSSCISNDYALWLIGGCTASKNSKEDDTMISCSTILQLSLSEKPKWRSVASLMHPRHALTAVLHDEFIYVLGGVESASKCASDKVEMVNILGNVSAMCTKMPVPVAGCTSVLVVPEKINSSHEIINDTLQDFRYTEEASDIFSTFSEKTDFMTGVNYSSESSRTSSIDDIYSVDRNNYLSSTSASNHLHTEIAKEILCKEAEEIGIPDIQDSFKIKDDFSSLSKKTEESKIPVTQISYESREGLSSLSEKTEGIKIPVTQKSYESKEGLSSSYEKTEGIQIPVTQKSYESKEDLSSLSKKTEEIKIPVTRKSFESKEDLSSLSEKTEGIQIPVTQKSYESEEELSSFYEKTERIPVTQKSYESKEDFSSLYEKTEGEKIPVAQKSYESKEDLSSLSEKTEEIKIPVTRKRYESKEGLSSLSEKTEGIKISVAQKSYESKEDFSSLSEKTEQIKIPVIQESFKTKDILSSESSWLKGKCSKRYKYRTSMEIFLDSGEIGPYPLRKETSQASKWLHYLKKLSSSDEKFHKEIFQSKEPKLDLKTDVYNDEVEGNFSGTEVKYIEKNENVDLLTSAYVQNSLSSQHESFAYVKSNMKMQHKDQDFEKEYYTPFSYLTDLGSENMCNDVPRETEIRINENSLPIILLIGGEYSRKFVESKYILSYYCNENVWQYAGFMPEYRCYHSAVFLNNKIYIIGGFKSENSKFNENITNRTICYDICHKIWHDGAITNCPRAFHSAVVLEDKIYILGGRDQSGEILSSAEVYDESSDIWKECESLPYPVLGAASFTLKDSIYVFGGITYEEDGEIISSKTAFFDTQKNSWITSFEMPVPLAFCGLSKYLNSVWLFGGLKNDLVSSEDIFKCDVLTKTWSKVAKLSTPRLASVIISIEEKAYIIGGHSTQEKKEVLTCELFDLSKNEMSLLKSLPIGISGRAGIAIT